MSDIDALIAENAALQKRCSELEIELETQKIVAKGIISGLSAELRRAVEELHAEQAKRGGLPQGVIIE